MHQLSGSTEAYLQFTLGEGREYILNRSPVHCRTPTPFTFSLTLRDNLELPVDFNAYFWEYKETNQPAGNLEKLHIKIAKTQTFLPWSNRSNHCATMPSNIYPFIFTGVCAWIIGWTIGWNHVRWNLHIKRPSALPGSWTHDCAVRWQLYRSELFLNYHYVSYTWKQTMVTLLSISRRHILYRTVMHLLRADIILQARTLVSSKLTAQKNNGSSAFYLSVHIDQIKHLDASLCLAFVSTQNE